MVQRMNIHRTWAGAGGGTKGECSQNRQKALCLDARALPKTRKETHLTRHQSRQVEGKAGERAHRTA